MIINKRLLGLNVVLLFLLISFSSPVLVLATETTFECSEDTVFSSESISGYCGGEGDGTNLTWILSNDGTLIISGEGEMADFKRKEAPWFTQRDSMTNLVIEYGVTSIGEWAFSDCTSFTDKLTIPDSVVSIGVGAFSDCPGFSGSLVIPQNVTSIEDYVFRNCSGFTGSLIIPDGVTTLGRKAFSGCTGFTGALFLPEALTTIGDLAFLYCSGFTGNLTIPNNVTYIGEMAFCRCSGFTGSLIIPESVITIVDGAFDNCDGFTDLRLPSSIVSIGYASFVDCNKLKEITVAVDNNYYSSMNGMLFNQNQTTLILCPINKTDTITIPESVTVIEDYAFSDCVNLKNIVIPESVTSIGVQAFRRCYSLTGVYFKGDAPSIISADDNSRSFPSNLTLYHIENNSGWTTPMWEGYTSAIWDGVNISDYETIASGYCGSEGDGTNLTWTLTNNGKLTISGTGSMANYEPGYAPWYDYADTMTTLVLENGVTTIGDSAFYYCTSFTGSLIIPEGVTSIGEWAFYWCRGFNGNPVIPEGVTSIGSFAFYFCDGFTGDLIIPESVTTIGECAFYCCFGFTGCLTIPEGVTSIGKCAFSDCPRLTDIIVEKNNSTYCSIDGMLLTKDGTTLLCCPAGKKGTLAIPESVTTLGDGAFEYCSGLTGSLTIPESVTTIGNYAFGDCSGLTGDLTIPANVSSIGDWAFYDCSGFTGSLTIPEGVTTIGFGTFSGCSGFTGDLNIPESVTTIGIRAFDDCSGFSGNLIIPENVIFIDSYAFRNCTSFKGVYFKGDAPEVTAANDKKRSFPDDLQLYYPESKDGWSTPTWNGYNTAPYIVSFDTITETVTLFSLPEDTEFVFIAAYKDDQLLSIISGAFGSNNTVPFLKKADKIKVFYLGKNYQPVAINIAINID